MFIFQWEIFCALSLFHSSKNLLNAFFLWPRYNFCSHSPIHFFFDFSIHQHHIAIKFMYFLPFWGKAAPPPYHAIASTVVDKNNNKYNINGEEWDTWNEKFIYSMPSEAKRHLIMMNFEYKKWCGRASGVNRENEEVLMII